MTETNKTVARILPREANLEGSSSRNRKPAQDATPSSANKGPKARAKCANGQSTGSYCVSTPQQEHSTVEHEWANKNDVPLQEANLGGTLDSSVTPATESGEVDSQQPDEAPSTRAPPPVHKSVTTEELLRCCKVVFQPGVKQRPQREDPRGRQMMRGQIWMLKDGRGTLPFNIRCKLMPCQSPLCLSQPDRRITW